MALFFHFELAMLSPKPQLRASLAYVHSISCIHNTMMGMALGMRKSCSTSQRLDCSKDLILLELQFWQIAMLQGSCDFRRGYDACASS